MVCPHCQQPIEAPVTRLRRERRAKGLCIRCGDPLVAADRQHARCRACRVIEAAMQKRRRK